jgi:hypothetical protein
MRGACRISWPPYLAIPGGNRDDRGEHTGCKQPGGITVCVILATLAVIPLRIVFRKSSGDAGADHVVMGE